MAHLGFNICIISRTESKIKEKLESICKQCEEWGIKKPQTASIVFDFAENTTIDDYEIKIGQQLKFLDISMLFLNAGYAQVGPFDLLPPSEIER